MISKKSSKTSNVGGNNTLYEPDPEKWRIASAMVYGSVLKRRNEQSINWYMLALGIFGLVFLPFWWISEINQRANVASVRHEITTPNPAATFAAQSSGTHLPSMGLATIPAPTIANNPIGQPINITVIMPTPQATITPGAYSVVMVFRYSYYNPELGGVNCAVWENNTCVSTLANGEDWRGNFGKVIACPPDMALGTVLDVTYPPALVGQWICKDRGGAIVGDIIDFLDVAQRADWLSPIAANVYPPGTPLMQTSSGTH